MTRSRWMKNRTIKWNLISARDLKSERIKEILSKKYEIYSPFSGFTISIGSFRRSLMKGYA